MNNEQFDICLEFHLGLIRSRPHKQTVDDARGGIENGTYPKGAAANLLDALDDRMSTLARYPHGNDDYRVALYNLNNTRNPSPGAFAAAFSVINDGAEISKAAKANGVNYQSVKVLIPRLKRWERFAKKLAKTL